MEVRKTEGTNEYVRKDYPPFIAVCSTSISESLNPRFTWTQGTLPLTILDLCIALGTKDKTLSRYPATSPAAFTRHRYEPNAQHSIFKQKSNMKIIKKCQVYV